MTQRSVITCKNFNETVLFVMHWVVVFVVPMIDIFLVLAKLKRNLLFDVEMPSRTTVWIIKEAWVGKGLVAGENVDDMFKKLNV